MNPPVYPTPCVIASPLLSKVYTVESQYAWLLEKLKVESPLILVSTLTILVSAVPTVEIPMLVLAMLTTVADSTW